MPSREEKALDWAIDNSVFEPQQSSDIINKLGVDQNDIKAWKFSKQNPEDPKSVPIRNKLFTKIADNVPIDTRRGFGAVDRFRIKNFADDDIKMQNNYLKDRGVITKIKVGEQLFNSVEEVEKTIAENNKASGGKTPLTINTIGAEIIGRRPNESSFAKIEPELAIDKFDFADWAVEMAQDVSDVSRELVEGAAITLSTGSKLIGSIGGPAALGAAAAGSAIGGAIGGLTESARQRIGADLGLAKLDPDKVSQQALITGGIPLGLDVFKGVAKTAVKGVGLIPKAFGIKPKEDVEIVKAAAQELGVIPTPSQLFSGDLIKRSEESLVRGDLGKLSGVISGIPKQVEVNKSVLEDVAKELVSSRSLGSEFQSGVTAGKKLTAEVEKKIKPAADIYKTYDTLFKEVKPDTTKLKALFNDLFEEFRFDDEALAVVKAQSKKLDLIQNLDDLKQFRTSTGKLLRNQRETRASSMIYEAATETRNETLLNAAKEAGGELAEQASKDIPKADAIYRQAAKAVDRTFLRRGQVSKLSPKKQTSSFFDRTKEINVIKKILDTDDPTKIELIKKEFPESFEFLRQNLIEEIGQKAEVKGVINPARLSKALQGLPEESRILIFGRDKEKKIQSLKTYLDSVPDLFNKSGSGHQVEFNKGILHQGMGRYFLLEILANSQLGNTLVDRAAKGIASPVVKGAAVSGRGLFIPNFKPREEETK